MRWLITGGCGFVGTNLAHRLLSAGHDVVILDNLSRVGSRDNLAWLQTQHGQDWQFVQADTRDPDTIVDVIRGARPDALAHRPVDVALRRPMVLAGGRARLL